MGSRISLDEFVGNESFIRIRNSQIRGILHPGPVTEMIKRRKPRWFGAPNGEGWQQESLASMGKRVEGSQEVKDRMGRACVATDVENGMLLPKSTEFGKDLLSAFG